MDYFKVMYFMYCPYIFYVVGVRNPGPYIFYVLSILTEINLGGQKKINLVTLF